MSEHSHSPTPWEVVEANENHGAYVVNVFGGDVCDLYAMSNPSAWSVVNGGDSHAVPFLDADANAAFIVKAVNAHDKLVEALRMQEDAELAHANCDECDGEKVPELCPKCFPLFDDARIARRALLASIKDRA